MKSFFIIYVLSSLFDDTNPHLYRNLTCGLDKSNATVVYEGLADIGTYPWMGTLYYPMGAKKITTTVVLVTRQIALAAANDMDILPKDDIRHRARVVIGQDCENPGIKIRDYSYHPDFRRDTYSALVMIQLDVDIALQELRPICGPPSYFINPQFYAMTAANDCKKGQIHIRKMKYVDKEFCKQFYEKSKLDDKMFWPSHVTCARALSGGKCMWRSGTALVVKQDGHWRLLGFGLYGPGCQSPARFLDYGMEEQWVRKSVARIGQPAITRMSQNYLIMRRPLSSLQRFGPCDPEETKYEMFTDRVSLKTNLMKSRASYNITLIHGVEYSCVILKVKPETTSVEEYGTSCDERENPRLNLRRWCAGPPQMCYGFQYLEINFYLEIDFKYRASFVLLAYGKSPKVISPLKALTYANSFVERPVISTYFDLMRELRTRQYGTRNFYLQHFFHNIVGKRTNTYEEIKKKEYKEIYDSLYKYLVYYQQALHPVIHYYYVPPAQG